MPFEQFERKVHECPRSEIGKHCPVAIKFRQNSCDSVLPVPEAYRATFPEVAKLVIVGINPGIGAYECGNCVNEYSMNFEKYRVELRSPISNQFWQYFKASKLLGYDFVNEVMVTNLVHCPTRSWSKKSDKEWWLEVDKKQESINLCNHFCLELLDIVKPEGVLLHGLDVIEFFRKRCGWFDIPPNPKSIDIQGLRKEWKGMAFILSRHLQSRLDAASWNKLANGLP